MNGGQCSASRRTAIAARVVIWAGVALFWLLRLLYWSRTDEAPFSDMADYDAVAHNIVERGFFGVDDFWATYWPPATPCLRALSLLVARLLPVPDLLVWRLQMAVLVLCAAAWLARELRLLTGRPVLAAALIPVVAVTRSSVFWSLKVATELTAEAMLYATCASVLGAVRQPGPARLRLAGAVVAAGMLNRPANGILILVGAFVLARGLRSRGAWRRVGWFLAGLLTVWTPWIARNAVRYGAFVPLTTQAPYTFLTELGRIEVVVDGVPREVRLEALMAEHRRTRANDYEGMRDATRIDMAWIAQHPDVFAFKLCARAVCSTCRDEVSLTRVQRRPLLPWWWERLLPDRRPLPMLLGLAGLIGLGMAFGPAWFLILAVAGPWSISLLFLGEPRLLEPAVALCAYGCVWSLALALGWCFRTARGTRPTSLH